MLNIVPIRVSLVNQDVAALLAEMEEAVAINELAGCGCGCDCEAEPAKEEQKAYDPQFCEKAPEDLAQTMKEALDQEVEEGTKTPEEAKKEFEDFLDKLGKLQDDLCDTGKTPTS